MLGAHQTVRQMPDPLPRKQADSLKTRTQSHHVSDTSDTPLSQKGGAEKCKTASRHRCVQASRGSWHTKHAQPRVLPAQAPRSVNDLHLLVLCPPNISGTDLHARLLVLLKHPLAANPSSSRYDWRVLLKLLTPAAHVNEYFLHQSAMQRLLRSACCLGSCCPLKGCRCSTRPDPPPLTTAVASAAAVTADRH